MVAHPCLSKYLSSTQTSSLPSSHNQAELEPALFLTATLRFPPSLLRADPDSVLRTAVLQLPNQPRPCSHRPG